MSDAFNETNIYECAYLISTLCPAMSWGECLRASRRTEGITASVLKAVEAVNDGI